jgi:hypothetical protein
MPDPYTDRTSTCPTCGSPARIRGGEGADPDAQVTLWYEPAVTPGRLKALEAEHAALLAHVLRDPDCDAPLRDYIDWLKRVYQPSPRNRWIALLEAAARVEATARPATGEVTP